MARLRLQRPHVSGLALGLVAPLVLFALLQIPDYVPEGLVFRVPVAESAACPAATVSLPGTCVTLPPVAGEIVPFHECDPGGSADALWRTTVRFEGLGPQDGCDYAPRVVDSRSLSSALSPEIASRHDTYPRWSARRDGRAWVVDIDLAPWRASAVVLTRAGDLGDAARVFASAPVPLRAIRRDGISVRESANLAFAIQCALSVLAMALMLRFRPGRRGLSSGVGPARPRWVSVAAASAVGGGLMAVHAATRPADYGGFDVAQPWRVVMQLPLGMVAAGFGGLWTDFCRRTYQDNLGFARGMALLLAVVVIALLAPRVYLATSAWTLPGLRVGYGYKTRYYTYFAVAGLMPLVTVRLRASARSAAASTLSCTLKLFGVAFAACALATMVAIVAAEYLPTELMPERQMGFFKPVSGWGLLAIAAPALLGIAIGVCVPEHRPPWLARLEAASAATVDEPDAAERARRFLALVASLCRRERADPGCLAVPEAASLAHHVGWLLPSFCRSEADRDQLAAAVELPRALADPLLERVLRDLELAKSVGPRPLSAQIPLTDPAFSHARVTVFAERALPAGETPVILIAHGTLLDGPPLQRVTATVDQVLAFSPPPATSASQGLRVLVELTAAPAPTWSPSLEAAQLGLAVATFCALRGLPDGFAVPAVRVDPDSGALSAPASLVADGPAASDLPGFLRLVEDRRVARPR